MSFLRHGCRLLIATPRLAAAFLGAERYWQLHHALRDLALPPSAVLTATEIRRFRHYHLGTTYLAVLFCTRLGRRRTARERALFSNLAALACFFDDLVDAWRTQPGTTIWPPLQTPEAYGHTTDPRGLSLHFLKNIREKLPPERLPEFQDWVQRVFQVETAGQQRSASNFLKINDLEKITAEKGGCSVVLFRCLISAPLSEGEQSFWQAFGLLIQLCDDIFDLWHDRQAGVSTLATRFAAQNDIVGLTDFFEKQALVVTSRAGCLRGEIHFLLAITRVCLRHYAGLRRKYGSLPLDDRHLMVMDMERWPNRWRAAVELFRA